MSAFRKIMCYFGRHKRLDEIQRFGVAAHVGCPDCGREYGMHDGLRAFIPWDGDLADMYRRFGHDVDGPRRRWLAVGKGRP